MPTASPTSLVDLHAQIQSELTKIRRLRNSGITFEGRFDDNATHALVATTNVAFGTLDDPLKQWDAANHRWVIPIDGRYLCSAMIKVNSAGALIGTNLIRRTAGVDVVVASGGSTLAAFGASTIPGKIVTCLAGDAISIYSNANCVTQNDGAGVANTYLSIVRVAN